MYIPKYAVEKDEHRIVSFMQRFSFAVLVTNDADYPEATHLPFVVEHESNGIILTSHLARANPQGKVLSEQRCLVIFSEPHAYISPKYYAKELNVPTWNYMTVHAYGKAQVIEAFEKKTAVLEKMIQTYEPEYKSQWDRLPDKYKSGMINDLTAFSIQVENIQAKHKLSQNKTTEERQRIIEGLSQSEQTHEQLVADYMRKNHDRT